MSHDVPYFFPNITCASRIQGMSRDIMILQMSVFLFQISDASKTNKMSHDISTGLARAPEGNVRERSMIRHDLSGM